MSTIRKIVFSTVLLAFSAVPALAQSLPPWPITTYGYVATPAQWGQAFQLKQDYLGSAPCTVTGCIFTGPITLVPSTASFAGLNIAPGVAPTSPNNGDTWVTSAGLFVRVNGVTVGPLIGASGETLTAGSTATSGYTSGQILGSTGSVLSVYSVSGTGSTVALTTSPSFTTPSLGVATGTSLALNGCSLGGAFLCVNGNLFAAAINASAAMTVTSASGSAFAVGPNGSTNPTFAVDGSAGSSVNGIKITGAGTGGTANISVTDSGSSSSLAINAKGPGTIAIGSVSTGAVTITPATTLSGALTYGGVTLSNSVSGTGSMALTAGTTFTGTTTVATLAATTITGTSLALNGCSLGAGDICTTNAANFGSIHGTSASASALTVGLNGVTNPAFNVDASTSLQAAGLNIKGAVTGGTVAISAIDSGASTNLPINAKGTGTISIAGASSGAVSIGGGGGGLTVTNSFTATGLVTFVDLVTGTQDTVIGYWGSTTASALAINNCLNALTYNTSTHAFGCNATAGTGTVTSVTCGTGLSGGTFTTTGTCAVVLPKFTNSLTGSAVGLNTSTYTDGPSVAQGTSGTWFASGAVTLTDTSASADFSCKLWDGTTIIASGEEQSGGASKDTAISLSGYLTTPAANIRISCINSTSNNGLMTINTAGSTAKASTVSVIQIQ